MANSRYPRDNMDATTDPTVNDDFDNSYEPFSRWVNTASKSLWLCLDATPGAAVWEMIAIAPATPYIDDDLTTGADIATLASGAGNAWSHSGSGIAWTTGNAGSGAFNWPNAPQASPVSGNADIKITVVSQVVPSNSPFRIVARASALALTTGAQFGFAADHTNTTMDLWVLDNTGGDVKVDTAVVSNLAPGDTVRIAVDDLGAGSYDLRGYINDVKLVEALGVSHAHPGSLGTSSAIRLYSPAAGYNTVLTDAYGIAT